MQAGHCVPARSLFGAGCVRWCARRMGPPWSQQGNAAPGSPAHVVLALLHFSLPACHCYNVPSCCTSFHLLLTIRPPAARRCRRRQEKRSDVDVTYLKNVLLQAFESGTHWLAAWCTLRLCPPRAFAYVDEWGSLQVDGSGAVLHAFLPNLSAPRSRIPTGRLDKHQHPSAPCRRAARQLHHGACAGAAAGVQPL